MKETIIKGSHNSRSILGATTIPEDWAQARVQLIAQGWPIDLGPLDLAGVLQKGTDLVKATLLSDETAALYPDLPEDPTPDDAFSSIAGQFELILSGKAKLTIKLKEQNGKALGGVRVKVKDSAAETFSVTDVNGTASLLCEEGTVTVSMSGYADIADFSETISVTRGNIYTKEIIAQTRNFLMLTASKNVMFSGNVQSVDVTVVGGGGGGGRGTAGNGYSYSGGGGAGGNCIVQENVLFNPDINYQAKVGAGGDVGSSGGTSTFLDITAEGGGGADSSTGAGGQGNGNGGSGARRTSSGASNGGNGTPGTKQGYASFTETKRYGDGGGGGASTYSRNPLGGGGAAGGNNAGNGGGTADRATEGFPGVNGTGGGGGGGAATGGNNGANGYTGGKGGSGCVAIRMHLKTAEEA